MSLIIIVLAIFFVLMLYSPSVKKVNRSQELEDLKYNVHKYSGLHPESYLSFENNAITYLPPLSNLTSLSSLNLGRNAISNLWPISSNTALETLQLDKNSISNLKPLTGLSSLKYLSLVLNGLLDMTRDWIWGYCFG